MASPADLDVLRVRAQNPGPLTLSGTNTWIVGRDPAHVVDPGPALPAHLQALDREIGRRGGLGGMVLTHGHADHSEATDAVLARWGPIPVGSAQRPAGEAASASWTHLEDGQRLGPLVALATPGHAQDHLAFLAGHVCFTGDAVLGEGSVFIAPDPGAMAAYLAALQRLAQLALEVLYPGHGPPVREPRAWLQGYIDHRLQRERRVLEALADGCRSVEALLDAAWSEVEANLRPAAALTLAAHLDKLEQEGRLPDGVQRPPWPPPGAPDYRR
ncbi:MAG TPA: MBL fold metallo-hydrolase [Solirubrobacteraceae bacterium]|nr:MBL fold metallo-hydrolase [Solirubrobacteraceae bacterium]